MNIMATINAATSEQVSTIGRLYKNSPVLPGKVRNGKYATILVIVAKMIAVISFVGPSHEATGGGKPPASEFLIASPDTTGTSTSRPSAMISVAMETC